MANFCYSDQKYELFTECVIRGWLAALFDFPHFKSREEYEALAQRMPDEMRPEVCCVPLEDEYSYRQLIVTAWRAGCTTPPQASERGNVVMALPLKTIAYDEALALLRYCVKEEIQAEIKSAYAQFLSSRTGNEPGM